MIATLWNVHGECGGKSSFHCCFIEENGIQALKYSGVSGIVGLWSLVYEVLCLQN